ncbi:VOC family protein [uncultured Ferrimonas sp.]|uniref:VOC family protein n=1 Tax=uncultured Ferrimonas sp. TaxID=432640 RepID=UPI002617D82D|nr:VOC family protein [uncultured Ferrimonas sp.]
MELGAFSISLAVTDIRASLAFYQKLGFAVFGGDINQNWLIIKNGPHVIGLFQGMFERNCLTFNPGWDQHAQAIDPFTDVRQLQRQAEQQGLVIQHRSGDSNRGPGSFSLLDPDGNPLLIDQHR